MAQTPVVVSLLCCEQIIVEESTRNVTPVNCFSRRSVEAMGQIVSFFVVVTLTDGLGEMPIEVVIQRLDTMEEVFSREHRIELHNPLNELIYGFRIRECRFPVAGDYQVTVLANREMLAHRKIKILSKEVNS